MELGAIHERRSGCPCLHWAAKRGKNGPCLHWPSIQTPQVVVYPTDPRQGSLALAPWLPDPWPFQAPDLVFNPFTTGGS